MPRKEYKTITVKTATFLRFTRAIRKAQRDDPSLDNSTFLKSLVSKRQKNRRLPR